MSSERGLMGLLERNRKKLGDDLPTVAIRKNWSPAGFSIHKVTPDIIKEHAYGKTIDVGCGDMQYKDIIRAKVGEYDTVDKTKKKDAVKFQGDAQDLHFIADGTYDTVISTSVLEHLPNPFKAMSEMSRILKKGGTLIVTAPMICQLHEEPYDFYRFTKYGFEFMLKDSGFEVQKIIPQAGIFSFLGHQFSMLFVCLFWGVPVLKWIVFGINFIICVIPCYVLDKIFDRGKKLALGYTCVAKKI
ncbi:class I SAM-dependent methyltransferase [Candidatus Omnitrophota bacterium]